MSSRVAGAGLALIAAALLAVSVATPVVLPAQLSLFAGHPTVADHVRETQEVYVGFYAARLCNSGGDGTCKSGDPTTAFRMVGYAELGLTSLLAAISVALALLMLGRSERRKPVALVGWAAGALALGGAGALVLLGPFHGASAPIGIGMALQGAGIVLSMIAGVVARRRLPPLRLRVADRSSQPVAAMPTAQAFPPRTSGPMPTPASRAFPAARGAARDSFDEQSPDPFGPTFAEDRQYASGPQLRPLYDATPGQGGTGGLLPPTPISRAAIHPATGLPLSFASGELGPRAERVPIPPPDDDDGFSVVDGSYSSLSSLAPLGPPTADDPVAMSVPISAQAADEPRPMAAPSPPAAELRPPPPPTPLARVKPASIPPPLPPQALAASAPPAMVSGQIGAKPRTQVSLVPPMPDNDLPIAPPTAQIVTDGRPELVDANPNTEPTLFPRPETPLAAPPAPVAPPPSRTKRESQLPVPMRVPSPTRPPQLRAAVPMPARSAPSPTRPPPSPVRVPSPRPTMAGTVPPIPAIPAIPAIPRIPPIPAPGRAETDVTDPGGSTGAGGDVDQATASRVPLEVGDYTSQTNVSVDVPTPEDLDAASAGLDDASLRDGEDREAYVLDTSPSGEPMTADVGGGDAESHPPVPAVARPASPTTGQRPPAVPAVAAPALPAVRDRPMPKLPISTAPDSLPPPRDNKQAIGPSPACPQCEAPMAWVEEHLRFYCKSCRMYF